jgi:hypothetical protein
MLLHFFIVAPCILKSILFTHQQIQLFYVQAFHQNKFLINKQLIDDINPLYELADTSRIQLQKKSPNSVSFCTAHNTHATPS